MSETRPAASHDPEPRDLYWSLSFLRDGLQEVKQDLREFRREVAQQFAQVAQESAEFRKEVAQQFARIAQESAEFRKEVAQQFAAERQTREGQLADLRREMRQDLRHSLMAMVGVVGAFAVVVIAFIEYRLPGG